MRIGVSQSDKFLDSYRICLLQLRQFITFAPKATSPLYHLFGISLVSPKFQMRRVNAQLNVTAVHNYKPLWDWPIMQLIRKPMGANHLFLCLQVQYAISFPIGLRSCCSPQPAGVWSARLINFLPEYFFYGPCSIAKFAFIGTELRCVPAASCDSSRNSKKRPSTLQTFQFNSISRSWHRNLQLTHLQKVGLRRVLVWSPRLGSDPCRSHYVARVGD